MSTTSVQAMDDVTALVTALELAVDDLDFADPTLTQVLADVMRSTARAGRALALLTGCYLTALRAIARNSDTEVLDLVARYRLELEECGPG